MTLAGKTVLVTGSTGFLGGALAQRLAADGVQVRALARRPERSGFLRPIPNIEVVQGDITDAERMQQIAEGCEAVFHVAAALGGTYNLQYHINVEGTRCIMQAAASAGVKQFIHVSTIAVYGYTYRGTVTEELPHKPGNVAYNRTKSQAETIVHELGEQHNLPYSIIRPAMIYGPRSNMWTATMFKVARLNPTPFPGAGSGSAHPIFVDDVVDMLITAATHPAASGEAFNCAPDPAPTWRVTGHDRWLALPVFPLTITAPLIEHILKLRGEAQDLPEVIAFAQSQVTYSMAKARQLLNWQPKVSLPDGIQRCIPWLRQKGWLA
jgi:nucleoside-diphosphate-sugar epimerase